MKRLILSSNINATVEGGKSAFSAHDIVDILQQIEELKNCNVAMKVENKALLLQVGSSTYEIMKRQEGQYPARKIKKL